MPFADRHNGLCKKSIEVVAGIEAMSAAIRDALDDELPRLFAPLLAKTKTGQSGSLSLDADMEEGLLSTLLSADGLPPSLNRLQALKRPVDIQPHGNSKLFANSEPYTGIKPHGNIKSYDTIKRHADIQPQVNTKPRADIEPYANSELFANNESNADIKSFANSEPNADIQPRVKRKYTKRVHKLAKLPASYLNQTISSNALPINSDLPINSSPIAFVKTGVRLWATDRRGQKMAASMRGASSSFQTDRMTAGIIHFDMTNTGQAS